MGDATGALPQWWCVPALHRTWARVAERLERNGLRAEGRVVVDGLDRVERSAVTDLLGRSVTGPRAVIDLRELDARLRSRASLGLVEAAEAVTGRELQDRPARSARDQARRLAPVEAASGWLAEHPGIAWPWVDEWLEGLRRDRLLGRDHDPETLVTTALAVLYARREALAASVARGAGMGPAPASAVAPERPVSRTDLAARLCHDAHGLDDDRRLSSVVLRAVALALGAPPPVDARTRRDLWAAVGVLTDSVSATCLVWGLRLDEPGASGVPEPSSGILGPASGVLGPASGVLRRAPVHLTWWHLRAGLRVEPASRVLVCENPRVLEAVAQAELPGLGVVCTSGRPNLTTQEVLVGLASTGAPLLYHGDFDWPGIAMANDAVARFGARPFRMSSADYERAPASLPLKGAHVDPAWDRELGAAMRRRGLAVHEEGVLDDLLASLGAADGSVSR
ncbi:hypothetical protein GCM10023168_21940 [Fodinibacter luteus]|uniref:TIGR02679 family protein n=1 Tax=Fodinibacter luteus TaxID=552064 RepID=A0ABP8KHG6_9MICO